MKRRLSPLLLGVVYVVLLASSHAVRRLDSAKSAPPPADVGTVVLRDNTSIAFRRFSPASSPAATPVLLLHGSPGSSTDFRTFGPALGGAFRTIAPDLPGFGHSTRRVPDYSIEAHAKTALSFLDTLEISSVHVVGFSMGGGVALELARQAPDRLRSLTLLSAIGVQELELLGNYRLNHALHGLQLGILFFLHEGTPHFGLLDHFPLDVPYARNFFDTDQRPLRDVLHSIEAPVLIVHGRRDVLVPPAAAREHHRLVPHSEMVLLDENHFTIFARGDVLARPVSTFLTRVELGQARSRTDARPERVSAAERPFRTTDLPPPRGLALLALMALLAMATFVSEDLASIGTGLLVAQGRIGFLAGVVACVAGILLGDVAIYLAGRFLGRPWLQRAPIRWFLSPQAVERGRRWFLDRGPPIIFASRFLPGTRVATYFAAGLLAAGFWRFLFFLGLAVAVWVPLIVGAAALLGGKIFDLFDVFSQVALPGVLVGALAAWLILRTSRALFTSKGRRLLAGRWKRVRNWEFWPPWIFYLPVLLRVGTLGLRHRNLTLFTAANPAIPTGGFVGESKSKILAGLDQRFVARWTLLPSSLDHERRRAQLDSFIGTHGLALPVVLKPDVGERGTGVVIARTTGQIDRYLASADGDVIAQEFVAGEELGVFYVRRPGADRGEIFSITVKLLPTVTGDGRSTLEELILADPRAVAMASIHLDRPTAELDRIPETGESIPLVDIGTHCRGAVFLDGNRYGTPELERAVEGMSRSYRDFYFGRYDLRAPSYQHFERGEGIKIIELNGVSSEATHIYDPANSLLDAYRVLFRQWEIAFEIGALNAAGGARITSSAELFGAIRRRRS